MKHKSRTSLRVTLSIDTVYLKRLRAKWRTLRRFHTKGWTFNRFLAAMLEHNGKWGTYPF